LHGRQVTRVFACKNFPEADAHQMVIFGSGLITSASARSWVRARRAFSPAADAIN
jgi:hypothetical protein